MEASPAAGVPAAAAPVAPAAGAHVSAVVFWARWSIPSLPAVLAAEEIGQVMGPRVTTATVDVSDGFPTSDDLKQLQVFSRSRPAQLLEAVEDDTAALIGDTATERRLPTWLLIPEAGLHAAAAHSAPGGEGHNDGGDGPGALADSPITLLRGARPKYEVVDAIERLLHP